MATIKAPKAPKPRKPTKVRTLDRVPPEELKALVNELGLTHRDVAEAVGRSTSLVGGWLGNPGQMRPAGKGGELTRPTNPPLARPRLAKVTKQLKAFARRKAKGETVIASPKRNPKDQNVAAHEAGEPKTPAHIPAALVERRRRQKAERVLRGGEGAAGYPD